MPLIHVLGDIQRAEEIMHREGKTCWFAGLPNEPIYLPVYATAEENIKSIAEAGIPFRRLPEPPPELAPTHKEFIFIRQEMAKPISPQPSANTPEETGEK